MSKRSRVIIGVCAIVLTLGAIPLAAGRDLAGGVFNRAAQFRAGTPAPEINRAAKADRAGSLVRSGSPMQTISLQLNGLSDTSVLVRIPVAQAGRAGSFVPSWTKSGNDKRAVACEPVVSVLTDVAQATRARPLRDLRAAGHSRPHRPQRSTDPTGKSPGVILGPSVQPLLQKYSDFQNTQISCISLFVPPTQRGVAQRHETRSGDAVDAGLCA